MILFFAFIIISSLCFMFCFQSLYLQINVAVQCLSTDFSSQKGVKVIFRLLVFIFYIFPFCVWAHKIYCSTSTCHGRFCVSLIGDRSLFKTF